MSAGSSHDTRCEKCGDPRDGEPTETVDGRGDGWKCETCRWWNWLSGSSHGTREALRARIIANHPLQYGIRHVATDGHPFGETVYDPGDDPTVGERYNRCPTCEEWSPCDVRALLGELDKVERREAVVRAREVRRGDFL